MSLTPNQKDLLAKKTDLEGVLKPDENNILHLPDVTISLSETEQGYSDSLINENTLLLKSSTTENKRLTIDGEAGLTFTDGQNVSNITGITSTAGNSSSLAASQSMVSAKQDRLTAGTNITIENNVISAQGGGSDVTITPTLSTGTKIADFEIDGVSGSLYAPQGGSGGSSVIPNPTGTPTDTLDTVSIDGTIYEIQGGGGESGSGYTEEVIYSATPTTAAPNTLTLTKPYTDFDILLFNLYRSADGVMNKYDRVILTNKLSLNDRIQLITYNEWASYDVTTSTSFTLINSNSMYIGSVVGLKFGEGGSGGSGSGVSIVKLAETDTTGFSVGNVILSDSITNYDILIFCTNYSSQTAGFQTAAYFTDDIINRYTSDFYVVYNGAGYCDMQYVDDTTLAVLRTNGAYVHKIYGVKLGSGGGSSSHTYSTTEQVVGTWIDGSDVYERTIVLRENGTNNFSYASDIFARALPADIDWIDVTTLYAKRNNSGYVDCMNNQQEIILVPNPTTQEVYFHSAHSHTDVIITIRYTKVTS